VREPGHVAQSHTGMFGTGVSYGIGIHAIAKDQYPRYRVPNWCVCVCVCVCNWAEASDKGRILGRYQSRMGQIKETARAKLGQSCLQCRRVASPWSSLRVVARRAPVVVARGSGFVSSYLFFTKVIYTAFGANQSFQDTLTGLNRVIDARNHCVCVFITAGPSTKLFTWEGGGYWGTCATRDDEPRPVWTSLLITH
jgi:hypothetical protein